MDENLYLRIDFETVEEYLYLLKAAGIAVNKVKKLGIMFCAAAVSDFFIPEEKIVFYLLLLLIYLIF